MIINFNHKYTVPKSSYLVTDIQCNVKVLKYRSGEFYLQYDWGCYSKEMTDIEIANRYFFTSMLHGFVKVVINA